jgi:hypothetical protein
MHLVHLLASLAFLKPLAAALMAVIPFALMGGVGTASVAKLGSGYMGNFGTMGIGDNTRDYKGAPDGVISEILLTLTITGTMAADPGGLVIGGLPRGVDDCDKLLTALFNNVSHRLDTSSIAVNANTFPQYRNVWQCLGLRDFGGTFMVDGFIPATASTAYTIFVPFPLGLPFRLDDGASFGQGATRVRQGEMHLNVAALTPTVTLTNNVFTVTAVSATIQAFGKGGSNSTVAKSWNVEWPNNLSNDFVRPAHTRILLADQTPAVGSTVSEQGYTVSGQENLTLVGPQGQREKYLSQVVPLGGYDITTALTPLIMLDIHAQLSSLPPPQEATVLAPSLTVINAMDLFLVDPPGDVVQTSATVAAGSATAPVAEVQPATRSMPAGSPIPPSAVGNVPSVFVAQNAAPAGSPTHASPAAAASNLGKRSLLQSALGSFMKR